MKKLLFLIAIASLSFQSFGALTLQQRVNISKSAVLTDAVTFVEKCAQSIKKAAQEILDGTITPAHTAFAGHPVQQNQLNEWAFRALRGTMDSYMIPMIMDQSTLPADPTAATDVQINTSVRNSLWPYVQQIGQGSF